MALEAAISRLYTNPFLPQAVLASAGESVAKKLAGGAGSYLPMSRMGIEQVRLGPAEMMALWTAFSKNPYRLSVAYRVRGVVVSGENEVLTVTPEVSPAPE